MASGDLLVVLRPGDIDPAGTTATLDFRNGHPVLGFDDTTDEEAVWSAVMPAHYAGGGVTATLMWAAADTTVTPHNAVFQGAFERVADDAQDMDSDSFASFQSSGAVAEASASGELSYDDIGFSAAEADGVAAGELFRFKLRRDADDTSGTDSLTGDAEVAAVALYEA